MKQEDLKDLKIEDLEEVIEGYWPDGEEMIVSDGGILHMCDLLCVNENINSYYKAITKTGNFRKAYKIPQPKMRDMNRNEISFYLWEKNKTECTQVSFNGSCPTIEFNKFEYKKLPLYKFETIDRNGKITKFKLPQVERKYEV